MMLCGVSSEVLRTLAHWNIPYSVLPLPSSALHCSSGSRPALTRRIETAAALLESRLPLPAYCSQSELGRCCLYLASYCSYLALWPPISFCMADPRQRKFPDLKGGTSTGPAGRC